MKKVRHVLGISGGKDSSALAIFMKKKFPLLDIEYYTCDTGKELDETYKLIDNLEVYLGKKILRLTAAPNSHELPFDHFLKMYGGFLPSSNSRWCTKKLKLEPFEKFVGDDPVISYVGIRGDEEREGYISKKSNIQSIFPFRKNIWSEDVISKVLANANIKKILDIAKTAKSTKPERFDEVLGQTITASFSQRQKLNMLLDTDLKAFNKVVFEFLKTTAYPLSKEQHFPLIEKEEVLIREDIFKLLEESGVGVPAYYKQVGFKTNGNKDGVYARSRSGCYFCFFQQKIEWVWLYEQHPELYKKAMEYEKDGYTWTQTESLAELIKPERIQKIKEDYLKVVEKKSKTQSPYLIDILADAEGEGCAACFI